MSYTYDNLKRGPMHAASSPTTTMTPWEKLAVLSHSHNPAKIPSPTIGYKLRKPEGQALPKGARPATD